MSAVSPDTGTLQVRLDRLYVPDTNIREIDHEWVTSLRGSIKECGRLVEPIEVRRATAAEQADGYDYALIAGFHRVLAAQAEGYEVVPAFLGDPENEDTDRAIENIAKKPLNPYEPRGIALDASFGGPDDAITSGFGAFVAGPPAVR